MSSFRPDRLITLGLVQPTRRICHNALGLLRWTLNVETAPPRPVLPILMYHSISEDAESGVSSYYRVCTSPRRFAEQMQCLADLGYRGVTLSTGLAWLKNQPDGLSRRGLGNFSTLGAGRPPHATQRPDERLVAITFDDGFRDFDTATFTVLQQHDFSATMYLPTAFIGDERRKFKGRECLTWAEVRTLLASGIEFGSHTVNHPELVRLPWKEIAGELQVSKAEIEHQLGVTVSSFAYPFAFPSGNRAFASRFRDELLAAGYDSCVTTEIGAAAPATSAHNLPRYPVNEDDDSALLQAKFSGAYDWLRSAQRLVKKTKAIGRRAGSATSLDRSPA